MSKREILAGATDQTVDIFIQDSSSSTGAGLTGLVFNSAGLTCYFRKGATGTPTQLTLATQTVGGAHSDGGFVAVDGTNCPGQYRLDLSDTIIATAGMVTLYLKGATNMAPCVLEIEVVAVNKFDSVRGGLTALPNANAEAAGGLYTRGTGAGQINQETNGRIDANVHAAAGTAWASGAITAAAIASDAITAAKIASDAITAAKIAADAITAAKIAAAALNGKGDWNTQTPLDAAGTRAAVGLASANLDTQLSTIAAYIDTEIGTIVTQTSAASIRSAVGLASANLDTQLSTIAGYIDTEVATIVTQTSAASIRSAVGLAAANLDTQLDALPTATENADALLARSVATAETTAPVHSLCTLILAGLESSRAAGTWTIYRTDGTTTHATRTLTADAAADPIIKVE
jgi:hypothetical protein